MLNPGSQFDRYEIVATLGAGGMGMVYRARHARPGYAFHPRRDSGTP